MSFMFRHDYHSQNIILCVCKFPKPEMFAVLSTLEEGAKPVDNCWFAITLYLEHQFHGGRNSVFFAAVSSVSARGLGIK